MSIEVRAADERQAREHAKKLGELLKSPLVKMAVEGEGVELANGGSPIVYQPKTPSFFGLP
jgi:hypothetical protein